MMNESYLVSYFTRAYREHSLSLSLPDGNGHRDFNLLERLRSVRDSIRLRFHYPNLRWNGYLIPKGDTGVG